MRRAAYNDIKAAASVSTKKTEEEFVSDWLFPEIARRAWRAAYREARKECQ
jgi:hypothetical protein